jgi:hypothetical protein
MSEGSKASPPAISTAIDDRLGAILLVAVLVLSGLNASATTFSTAGAFAKLAIGLAHLALLGWATSRLLGLKSPRHLAVASHMLLGQIVALGYVYLRSALCSATGLPGISIPEVMLVEGVMIWFAWKREAVRPVSLARLLPETLPELLVHVFWLSWLAAVALQKLDLLHTPSSDPDIHAFYAKILIERGHLYYDLLPISDAWMVYPSGFSSLSFVLGQLSGLHPVQLVNIGPYLQFTLFCGAGFSVMSQSIARSRVLVALGLVHFGLAYLCFNAVLLPAREMLEGTPRLAHSAILFFPLFFVLQHTNAISRRPLLLVLPLCGIVTGMCINPTHAPAALLFGALALVPLLANRDARLAISQQGVARLAKTTVALMTVLFVFLGADPFYRSLVVQQSAKEGEIEQAHDLTGDALSFDFDIGTTAAAIRQALPRVPGSLLVDPGGAGATRPVQLGALLGLFFCVAATRIPAARRLRGRTLSEGERNALVLAGVAFVGIVIHALWLEATHQLAKPGVLQGTLLVRYTDSLQYQITTLFFAVGITALATIVFGAGTGKRESFGMRLGTGLLALGVCAGSLPLLVPAAMSQAGDYYPPLRASPLGIVYPSDLALLERAEKIIGREERVLLPGRMTRTATEHWVFTTDAGRAVPLFSDLRTSFFLGLDGWAFTAGAYQAHVKPPNFDPVWLRAQNVLWLIESGNFPVRILAKHYERMFGDDHAVLWRLRSRDQ